MFGRKEILRCICGTKRERPLCRVLMCLWVHVGWPLLFSRTVAPAHWDSLGTDCHLLLRCVALELVFWFLWAWVVSYLGLLIGFTVAPDNNIDLLGSRYTPIFCLSVPVLSVAFSIGTLYSIILHSTRQADCELFGLLQMTSNHIFQSIRRANFRALLPWASPSHQACFNEPQPGWPCSRTTGR